ncbi:MAG: hypothetical protein WCG05_03210 [Alphaproteobacteria bacterium]
MIRYFLLIFFVITCFLSVSRSGIDDPFDVAYKTGNPKNLLTEENKNKWFNSTSSVVEQAKKFLGLVIIESRIPNRVFRNPALMNQATSMLDIKVYGRPINDLLDSPLMNYLINKMLVTIRETAVQSIDPLSLLEDPDEDFYDSQIGTFRETKELLQRLKEPLSLLIFGLFHLNLLDKKNSGLSAKLLPSLAPEGPKGLNILLLLATTETPATIHASYWLSQYYSNIGLMAEASKYNTIAMLGGHALARNSAQKFIAKLYVDQQSRCYDTYSCWCVMPKHCHLDYNTWSLQNFLFCGTREDSWCWCNACLLGCGTPLSPTQVFSDCAYCVNLVKTKHIVSGTFIGDLGAAAAVLLAHNPNYAIISIILNVLGGGGALARNHQETKDSADIPPSPAREAALSPTSPRGRSAAFNASVYPRGTSTLDSLDDFRGSPKLRSRGRDREREREVYFRDKPNRERNRERGAYRESAIEEEPYSPTRQDSEPNSAEQESSDASKEVITTQPLPTKKKQPWDDISASEIPIEHRNVVFIDRPVHSVRSSPVIFVEQQPRSDSASLHPIKSVPAMFAPAPQHRPRINPPLQAHAPKKSIAPQLNVPAPLTKVHPAIRRQSSSSSPSNSESKLEKHGFQRQRSDSTPPVLHLSKDPGLTNLKVTRQNLSQSSQFLSPPHDANQESRDRANSHTSTIPKTPSPLPSGSSKLLPSFSASPSMFTPPKGPVRKLPIVPDLHRPIPVSQSTPPFGKASTAFSPPRKGATTSPGKNTPSSPTRRSAPTSPSPLSHPSFFPPDAPSTTAEEDEFMV